MANCAKCGMEFTGGEVFCKHCGNKVTENKRPVFVLIIAIYLFFSFAMSIFGLVTTLGLRLLHNVPQGAGLYPDWFLYFSQAVALLFGVTALICGLGLLKMKEWARKNSIILQAVRLTYTFAIMPVSLRIMEKALAGAMSGTAAGSLGRTIMLAGVILGAVWVTAVVATIIIYLARNKKQFS